MANTHCNFKNRKERINTQRFIVQIAEQRLAKGETLTEEENNTYQQAIRILKDQGLLSEQQQQQQAASQVELINMATIKPEPIRWLWTNYLAKGKLHILGGMAGTGKTTLAISLAATISTGGLFPDKQQCKIKGNVLIWSAEDDIKDTLLPRIQAAGADSDQVFCIECKKNPITEEKIPFDIAQDIPLLYKQVEQIGGIDLFIVDPIVSAVRGDMHKANDVRYSLQPLVDFAQKVDCAVLGITHFSKNTGGRNPLERVTGSQAFGALARIVLVAAKEQDGHTRVLAIAKSNIGSDNGGVHYSLEQVTLDTDTDIINASRVLWGEVLEGNATDLLNDLEQPQGDLRENSEPSETLRRILSEGKMLSNEVKKIMKDNGHTDKQIRTARQKIGVIIDKLGFGKDLKTYWELPHKCPNSPYMPINIMGTYEQKGHLWTNKQLENIPTKLTSSNKNLTNNLPQSNDDLFSQLTKKEINQLTTINNDLRINTPTLLIEWGIITPNNYHHLLNGDLQLVINGILESIQAQRQLNNYYRQHNINLKVTEQGELVIRVELTDDQEAL